MTTIKRLIVFTFSLMGVLSALAQQPVYEAEDVNHDGVVDVLDVSLVIDKILGITHDNPGNDIITTGIAVIDTIMNDMVTVPGGMFTMGCTPSEDPDCYRDESPVRQITLNDFMICRIEVTQALWKAVTGGNPAEFDGEDLPVENVSWNDCQKFISRLNEQTGRSFRLPTEAEWEYAARGGQLSQGYRYAGSNDVGLVAWYTDNSDHQTHTVATRQPNELGLYDMSGNVMEWCSDIYGIYNADDTDNPQGATDGENRVFRGGSWPMVAMSCRTRGRLALTPDYKANQLGLRLVHPIVPNQQR